MVVGADEAIEATESAVDGLSLSPTSSAAHAVAVGPDARESLDKWARDMANYADLGFKREVATFNDAVEDILLRLEEFEHLLEMHQGDAAVCLFKQMPRISQRYEEMEKVFDQVDRLEFMVARVKEDMDKVDRQLTEAEATVEGAGSGIMTLMPMIFVSIFYITLQSEHVFIPSTPPQGQKGNNGGTDISSTAGASGSSGASSSADYQPVRVFDTDDFFPRKAKEDA